MVSQNEQQIQYGHMPLPDRRDQNLDSTGSTPFQPHQSLGQALGSHIPGIVGQHAASHGRPDHFRTLPTPPPAGLGSQGGAGAGPSGSAGQQGSSQGPATASAASSSQQQQQQQQQQQAQAQQGAGAHPGPSSSHSPLFAVTSSATGQGGSSPGLKRKQVDALMGVSKRRREAEDPSDAFDIDGAGQGAKHWTDEEKSKLFTWLMGAGMDDHWNSLRATKNSCLRECAIEVFESKKTYQALKGCYERNFNLFKQIYAFESFHANLPGLGTLGESDRLREYERRLQAARKAGCDVGNVTARTIDHWHRIGWYDLFYRRWHGDPATTRPIQSRNPTGGGPPTNGASGPSGAGGAHGGVLDDPDLDDDPPPPPGLDFADPVSLAANGLNGLGTSSSTTAAQQQQQHVERMSFINPQTLRDPLGIPPLTHSPIVGAASTTTANGPITHSHHAPQPHHHHQQVQQQQQHAQHQPLQQQQQQHHPQHQQHSHSATHPHQHPASQINGLASTSYTSSPPSSSSPSAAAAAAAAAAAVSFSSSTSSTSPSTSVVAAATAAATSAANADQPVLNITITQSMLSTYLQFLQVQTQTGKMKLEYMRRREEREEKESAQRREIERLKFEREAAEFEHNKQKANMQQKADRALELLGNPTIDASIKQAAGDYLKKLFTAD